MTKTPITFFIDGPFLGKTKISSLLEDTDGNPLTSDNDIEKEII